MWLERILMELSRFLLIMLEYKELDQIQWILRNRKVNQASLSLNSRNSNLVASPDQTSSQTKGTDT
jgi:hypothetical protein